MLKKIILMSVFCIFAVSEKVYSLDNKEIFTSVMVGAGALGTIIYWANRESNDCLAARAELLVEKNKKLCNQAEMYAIQNSNFIPSSLDVLQSELQDFQKELLLLNNQLGSVSRILNDRYNSFLTPWNWSDKILQVSNTVKTAFEINEKTNISIQELLGRVNYLYCLKTYQSLLETVKEFVVKNREVWQQKLSVFQSINSLQELCESKEKIKIAKADSEQFFTTYTCLDTKLKQIIYSLNMQDRNISIESDFRVLGQQLKSLSDILSQHTKFLNIYLKYKECITHIASEHLLIKDARKIVGGSSYPLKDFINMLNFDFNNLKNICVQETVYKETILELLQEVKDAIIVSSEYVLDVRAYEMYLQQKRQIEIEEANIENAKRQARAAQEAAYAAQQAADAAQRQARATEEQNRLQREQNRLKEEQNRIEQERNNIERQKQQDARNNNNNRW